MTKAEYFTNLYYCHIKCCSEKEKCKKCIILEMYKEIYGNEKYNTINE